jgi:hypothetical protein
MPDCCNVAAPERSRSSSDHIDADAPPVVDAKEFSATHVDLEEVTSHDRNFWPQQNVAV